MLPLAGSLGVGDILRNNESLLSARGTYRLLILGTQLCAQEEGMLAPPPTCLVTRHSPQERKLHVAAGSRHVTRPKFFVLQEDGNLCLYKGLDPSRNKGHIWCLQVPT